MFTTSIIKIGMYCNSSISFKELYYSRHFPVIIVANIYLMVR